MKLNTFKNLLPLIFLSVSLFGCSQKNDVIDIDLSNLPKPKKIKITNKEDQINQKPLDNELIRDLVPLKDREQVLANFEFGKKDPFSQQEIQVKERIPDFKLKGFLTTQNNKYVFVSYRDKEGIITKDSIGGVNTSLLPDMAKVVKIDPVNKKLTIFYDNEEFILIL